MKDAGYYLEYLKYLRNLHLQVAQQKYQTEKLKEKT